MTRRELVNCATGVLLGVALGAAVVVLRENRSMGRVLLGQKPLEIGQRAPALVALDLEGRPVEVKSGPAVLIFFNTTCGSCAESAASWQAFAERLGQVRVVRVSADGREQTSTFVRRHGVGFAVVADAEHRVLGKYRVSYVPLVVLLDEEGAIRFVQRYGQRTAEALAEVERLVSGPSLR
ncbi:MAG: TlpA disulfide reductase family protein [bacterium]|jgi:peroxiredoxin|nr:TlpA family protein disulfide reductase [candidate division KSB1 bacterium]MDH7560903.1 TlpA disulfide reductase family protein [bacterium]